MTKNQKFKSQESVRREFDLSLFVKNLCVCFRELLNVISCNWKNIKTNPQGNQFHYQFNIRPPAIFFQEQSSNMSRSLTILPGVKRDQWYEMAQKLTMAEKIFFKNVYDMPQHSAESQFGFCKTSLLEFFKQKLNVVNYFSMKASFRIRKDVSSNRLENALFQACSGKLFGPIKHASKSP